MAVLNKTISDGTVIWKVVKRVPDPPVVTPTSLGVYTKSEVYTKAEINSLLGNYLPKTGGTLTGPLTINSTLSVSSTTTIRGSATISGSASISGNATVGGKLTMGSLVVPSAQGSGNFWIA